MVYLDEVGAFSKIVQFPLLLRCQKGEKWVPVNHLLASEYQFVEFEGAVALLIHVHLQGGIEGVFRDVVVVGEGYDIVAQFFQGFIGFFRPVFAFVQGAFYFRVAVEQRPLPAVLLPEISIGIEDVRAFEGLALTEVIDGAQAGCENQQNCGQKDAGRYLPQEFLNHFPAGNCRHSSGNGSRLRGRGRRWSSSRRPQRRIQEAEACSRADGNSLPCVLRCAT